MGIENKLCHKIEKYQSFAISNVASLIGRVKTSSY